jgi:hypothetical protein
MEPKSLNVIPPRSGDQPGVDGTVNSISSSLPLDKLNHKSMKSNMTGISVYVWAPLCRVKRNTRDKMFPGQPDRWWLSHWPRVGPITWSGGLEYEGFLELSRGTGEHSTEVVPPAHIGRREHGISKRFVCGGRPRPRRLYAGWKT